MTKPEQAAQEQPLEIDVTEAARRRAAGEDFLLLDVREPQELAICAIEDHLHIPMQQIPARLNEVPKDRPVMVLCHHGVRSMQVTMFLRRQGFDNATNLAGGIEDWAQRIDPGMARY